MKTLAIVAALAVFPAGATASVTATADRTQDPTVVQVKLHVNVKAKRPLERKVFVYACQDRGVLACLEEPATHKVRLHKGSNRLTVNLRVQAMRAGLGPVPEGWDGNPAERTFSVPQPADVVYYSFGKNGMWKEVRPLDTAMFGETLTKEGTTP